MNLPADAPFVSRPGSNFAAGVLSLGVHAVFVLLLVFGVSWQTRHPEPVMVDLWSALPVVEPPAAVEPPAPPEPLPEQPVRPQPVAPEPVKPVPEPVKPAPTPAPKPVAREPAPPPAPDIALEKKKAEAARLEKLKAMQAAEDKALEQAARAEAEAMKKARDKELAEQRKRDMLRMMEEEELMQRMTDETAATEARLAQARVAASKRQADLARLVGLHRNQISAKVRGNTRLPENLKGNPEVRLLVKLLPTGEVLNVRVTQSSGIAAFDEAVVRAIERSSPLPLPEDRDARAEFVPELSFVHRPKE